MTHTTPTQPGQPTRPTRPTRHTDPDHDPVGVAAVTVVGILASIDLVIVGWVLAGYLR